MVCQLPTVHSSLDKVAQPDNKTMLAVTDNGNKKHRHKRITNPYNGKDCLTLTSLTARFSQTIVPFIPNFYSEGCRVKSTEVTFTLFFSAIFNIK